MTLDRTALLDIAAKAKAAVPGPWHLVTASDQMKAGIDAADGSAVIWNSDRHWDNVETGVDNEANAEYIAAANPAVVTSLIDEVLSLRERLIAAEEALAPFDLACDLIADHYLDEDFIELPGTTPPASIKVGAFRAARRARAKIDGGTG